MKNKIIKSIVMASLVIPTITSCDDYLTEINPNETTAEVFWNDLSETQSGIYATYAVLRNDYVLNIRQEAWRSDMGWPGFGRPVAQSNDAGWSWYTQLYNYTTDEISSKWDALYTGVWRANQVIDALENRINRESLSVADQSKWDYQMGQARFMRGLMYFYLASSFNEGSVVLRKTVLQSTKEFNQPLAPADEVRTFYRDDLKAAYDLLPYTSPSGQAYMGLATKGTAATILGISHLYAKEYDQAATLFKEVITDKRYGYELVHDLSKLFTTAGEFNSESILEISYSLDQRPDINTWDDNCMYNRYNSMTTSIVGCLVPAWLVWEYNEEEMDPNVIENHIDNDITKPLKNVSLRASSMVALVNDITTPYYIKGNAAEQSGIFGGQKGEWGFGKYKKYTNHDIVTIEKPLMSGKNVVVNRLSDVYLMYAECLLQEDDVQGALDYINEIRYRWGLKLLGKSGKYSSRTYDEISYTKEEVLHHLQFVERPLELSVEGHQIRWQDLLRWGYLEDDDKNIFKRLSSDPEYEFWTVNYAAKRLNGTPIPEIKQNSMVSKIKPSNNPKTQKIDYEYDDAAINYRKSQNAYYAIPQKEIMNNTAIRK